MHADNLARWDGRRPFYEVWFLKLNHRESGTALWVRYTTLAPKREAEPARGELWGIFFDPASGEHRAGKRLVPMDLVGGGRDPLIRIGGAELSDGGARGELDLDGTRLAWDLRYEPNPTTFHHVPAFLRSGGLLPSMVCSPNVDLAVSGWFEVGGRRYSCAREPGQQGHIWGRKYGHRWSWGHCNAFLGAPGVVFEGVTAQLAVGPVVMPALTSVMVRFAGQDHVVNGPWAMLTTPSEHELGSWRFVAEGPRFRFTGELSARIPDIVGVGYTDTDGSMVYCHNAKVGSMLLDIEEREHHRWRTLARLEAPGTAALEFTERTRHLSVPLRAS